MNTKIKRRIIELAHATPSIETCGFIYYTPKNELDIYSCANIDTNPSEYFEIAPEDYIKAAQKGTIVGVYHSHPGDEEAFSADDIEGIQEVGVPLYLYTVGTGRWQEYIPATYEVDLVGLPFIWGLYDCYFPVRHGLWKKGIYLGDYDRDETFAHDSESKHLIINNFEKEGCKVVGHGKRQIGVLQPYDIILFNTESISRILPVHFGLFVGDSMFIHHPENRLSIKEQLSGHWIDRINVIVRHKNLS